MKKKEIKKIAKQIFRLVKESDRKKYSEENEPSPAKIEEREFGYCEFDESVSKKFSKFVLNLIKIKDKINIEPFNEGFSIFCDLNRVKSSKNYNTENTFDIRIEKVGFRIRRNYSNYLAYKDPNMLESLRKDINEINQTVSKELIEVTIDDLTVELNFSRENNLNVILG